MRREILRTRISYPMNRRLPSSFRLPCGLFFPQYAHVTQRFAIFTRPARKCNPDFGCGSDRRSSQPGPRAVETAPLKPPAVG